MILSNIDIKKCLNNGEIKIVPLKNDQICSASVDLTLDDTFFQIKPEYKEKTISLDINNIDELLFQFKANEVILRPGDLVLGRTLEKITLAPDICAILEGRSRYARVGLAIHITSGFINPGIDNRQILEIVNLSPCSLVLKPGIRICQVIFFRLTSPTSKPYAKFGTLALNQ
jgi:dCTP deaminase